MTAERIDRLAATPKTLAHLVADATDEVLDAQAADGEWSIRTILAHLRDDELLCMRLGLERALAEDEPEVSFLEGSAWHGGRNRSRDRKEQILGDFALQRQASVAILRSLREEDWERGLCDATRGRLTISQLVDTWVRHSDEHVAQIERLLGETLAEVQARRTAWAATYPRPPYGNDE
jgi:hypothetical protein